MSSPRLLLALVAAFLLAAAPACSKPGRPAASSGQPSAECGQKVEAFSTWMAGLASEYSPLQMPDGLALLEGAGAAPSADGRVVAVAPGKVWVQGKLLPDGAPLAAALESDRSEEEPLYFALDPDARWGVVMDALGAAQPRPKKVGFLFQGQRRTAPPPPSALGKRIAGTRALAQMARPVSEALAPCTGLADAFGAPGRADTPQHFARTMADGLTACGCKVDPAALQALAWQMFGGDGPVYAAVIVSLTPGDRNAQVIAAADGTPWSEVAPRVQALGPDARALLGRNNQQASPAALPGRR